MAQWMRMAAVAVAAAVLPAAALADRGAFTLEAGPRLSALRLDPEVGTGPAVAGTNAGVDVRLRYGLSNGLELTGAFGWTAPADYAHDGVTIVTDNGTFVGQLQGQLSSYEVLVGARWVNGLVLRWFVGLEAGAAMTSFTGLDLVDTARPGGPASFGLGLSNKSALQLVVAPQAGLEWAITDHWSLSVAPRLEWFVGAPSALALTVPLTVGYSWYR